MKPHLFIIWVTTLCILIGLIHLSCQQQSAQSGDSLLDRYCSGCHLKPNPADLSKEVWQDVVLPRMGYLIGATESYVSTLAPAEKEELDTYLSFHNYDYTIDNQEWNILTSHILSLSKDYNNQSKTDQVNVDLKDLRPSYPNFFISPPNTSYVKSTDQGYTIADITTGKLILTDTNLIIQDQYEVPNEGLIDIDTTSNKLFITTMGSFSPSDKTAGTIYTLERETGKWEIIIDGLNRPVHTSLIDIDNDQSSEILVSEYGKWNGSFSIWKKGNSGVYKLYDRFSFLGAIATQVDDINDDGALDFYALVGQGNEGVIRFLNDGEGNFTSEYILRFRPSQGSTSFQLIDINNDRKKDIIYTSGDNADYKSPPKPYHGVCIYLQDQMGHFALAEFYPLPGAYDAHILGNDGQYIFANSFFPDYSTTEPIVAAIINRQTGKVYSIPIHKQGRWIVSDCYQESYDSYRCLVGSLTMEAFQNPAYTSSWVSNGLPFMEINIHLTHF